MGILETTLKTFSEKIKTKLFKNWCGITNDKSLHNTRRKCKSVWPAHGQSHLAIWTNMLASIYKYLSSNIDKYIYQFGQMHYIMAREGNVCLPNLALVICFRGSWWLYNEIKHPRPNANIYSFRDTDNVETENVKSNGSSGISHIKVSMVSVSYKGPQLS